MQAAAPVMSGFVIYLIAFFSSITAYRSARKHFARASYIYAVLFFGVAFVSAGLFFFGSPTKLYAQAVNYLSIEPNKPIGVGKGIFPGRVVWVHNPKAAQWDGVTGNWWKM